MTAGGAHRGAARFRPRPAGRRAVRGPRRSHQGPATRRPSRNRLRPPQIGTPVPCCGRPDSSRADRRDENIPSGTPGGRTPHPSAPGSRCNRIARSPSPVNTPLPERFEFPRFDTLWSVTSCGPDELQFVASATNRIHFVSPTLIIYDIYRTVSIPNSRLGCILLSELRHAACIRRPRFFLNCSDKFLVLPVEKCYVMYMDDRRSSRNRQCASSRNSNDKSWQHEGRTG